MVLNCIHYVTNVPVIFATPCCIWEKPQQFLNKPNSQDLPEWKLPDEHMEGVEAEQVKHSWNHNKEGAADDEKILAMLHS